MMMLGSVEDDDFMVCKRRETVRRLGCSSCNADVIIPQSMVVETE